MRFWPRSVLKIVKCQSKIVLLIPGKCAKFFLVICLKVYEQHVNHDEAKTIEMKEKGVRC